MKENAPRFPPLRLALLGCGVAILVAAGWAGWRTATRHTLAVAAIPVQPTLLGRPSVLREKIAEGEQAARTYFHPADGLIALSRLYHANGFYNEALQCYEALRRLQPREARWPHLQAGILADFGRLDEALPREQQAAALARDYLPAQLRLGDILLKADKTGPAAKAYADAARRDAGNPYALLGLARCAIAAGEWEKARERLREAARLHPDFVGALSLLVTVSERLGDQAGATALRATIGKREFTDLPDPWLDGLSEDCYDPYRLSVAAALAKFSGDAAAARRSLERAVELAPGSSAYRRQLGKILLQAKEYPLARRQLESAVAAEPGDSDAWILLIELLTAMGDAGAAQQALSAGLASCPQSAALHYTYGQKLSRTGGNDPAAIAAFKTARSLRPNEANAYIDLALIYFRQERFEAAVAELKGALAVQPGHPLAMQVLARYAIDTKDEAAARHWIGQLREQPKVSPEDLRTIVTEYQQRFGRPP